MYVNFYLLYNRLYVTVFACGTVLFTYVAIPSRMTIIRKLSLFAHVYTSTRNTNYTYACTSDTTKSYLPITTPTTRAITMKKTLTQTAIIITFCIPMSEPLLSSEDVTVDCVVALFVVLCDVDGSGRVEDVWSGRVGDVCCCRVGDVCCGDVVTGQSEASGRSVRLGCEVTLLKTGWKVVVSNTVIHC